jgi:hypothetical protein
MIKVSLVVLALVFAAVTINLINIASCQTDGGQGASLDVPPPSPSTASSGGGGHRQIDFDKILKALEEGKKKRPDKFEDLKTLLWKEPITPDEYITPTVLMYYKDNDSEITRNEPVEIYTNITNSNPIEIRRVLYLYLEVLDPENKEYRQINLAPEIIQTNDYNKKNTTFRRWDVLPSFSYLRTVGQEKIRVKISDGVNKWYTTNYSKVDPPYYRELVFNVTNIPPEIRNYTVTGPEPVRYADPIIYEAETYDPDGDTLNVTLHVLDEKGKSKMNLTQQVKGGSPLVFKAADWGVFSENDAGKNFTYYYYVDDGISNNTTKMDMGRGPRLRPSVKLKVNDVHVTPENDNKYWWQKYNFSYKISNQDLQPVDVIVTLYTSTPSEPRKSIDTMKVTATSDPQTKFFEVWPFSVVDAGEDFTYSLEFSEDVQGHNNGRVPGLEVIALNSRIVKYNLASWPLANVFLIFVFALFAGIFIERWFYR